MTFEEFWKEFTKDLDVWNMSLETYNYYRKQAMEIWKSMQ